MLNRITTGVPGTQIGTAALSAALCVSATSVMAHVGPTAHSHPHGMLDGSFIGEVIVGLIVASTILGASLGFAVSRRRINKDNS